MGNDFYHRNERNYYGCLVGLVGTIAILLYLIISALFH